MLLAELLMDHVMLPLYYSVYLAVLLTTLTTVLLLVGVATMMPTTWQVVVEA